METYRKFLLNEAMPCDGCIHKSKCKAEHLACLAFALYVDKGHDNWTLPRLPTKKTYARIMGTFDASLRTEINQLLKEKELL